MPKEISAGLLMYRRVGEEDLFEVLLAHPGGPYYTRKDLGVWSIPKGGVEPHEIDDAPRPWGGPQKPRLTVEGADLLATAQREFTEETGFEPDEIATSGRADYLPLGGVKYRNHKLVFAWAFEGDCDAGQVRSMTFEMEWPRGSGRHIQVPEVDRAAWFTFDEAEKRILPAQRRFLYDLRALLHPEAQTTLPV